MCRGMSLQEIQQCTATSIYFVHSIHQVSLRPTDATDIDDEHAALLDANTSKERFTSFSFCWMVVCLILGVVLVSACIFAVIILASGANARDAQPTKPVPSLIGETRIPVTAPSPEPSSGMDFHTPVSSTSAGADDPVPASEDIGAGASGGSSSSPSHGGFVVSSSGGESDFFSGGGLPTIPTPAPRKFMPILPSSSSSGTRLPGDGDHPLLTTTAGAADGSCGGRKSSDTDASGNPHPLQAESSEQWAAMREAMDFENEYLDMQGPNWYVRPDGKKPKVRLANDKLVQKALAKTAPVTLVEFAQIGESATAKLIRSLPSHE